MHKYISLICLLACTAAIIPSCKGKNNIVVADASDTTKFFPIAAYLKSQVAKVDSSAAFIYKITVENGKKDSTPLTKQQFEEWARMFWEFDISDKSIHRYYKENIFLDQTTNSYTFDYSAKDSSVPLQDITILLDLNGQQPKRVFMNKVKTNGDTTITEKGGWKNDESFYINRIIEPPDGATITQQNIIVWNEEP